MILKPDKNNILDLSSYRNYRTKLNISPNSAIFYVYNNNKNNANKQNIVRNPSVCVKLDIGISTYESVITIYAGISSSEM